MVQIPDMIKFNKTLFYIPAMPKTFVSWEVGIIGIQQFTVHCIPQTVSYLAIIIVNIISLYSYEMQFEQLIQMHCPNFSTVVV